MPTTGRGYTYPASTGHTRIWEHLETLAEDINDDVDDIANPAWTTYTPTWTGSLTNPVLGNGTLEGKWRQVDPLMVAVRIKLVPGSTTTFGSGNYKFALPVAAVSGGPHPLLQASALMGSSLYRFVGWVSTVSGSATEVTVYRDNLTSEPLSGWTPTAPVTFANGHSFGMYGFYFSA
ncbi:hypothetical protein O7626_31355 [Micromonospora sp. WMMD1102]|uniref:hypothetical protein n=1 Tax=Micromonospora sp. WMMD1102 TaxID=3016105 RepID=UPI0024159523|nr:hypothetical protein [Micromonospora sp. WMMD1102]MDG4790366.1 hypothetical protein [Micromonospora sp. WMMD1102]